MPGVNTFSLKNVGLFSTLFPVLEPLFCADLCGETDRRARISPPQVQTTSSHDCPKRWAGDSLSKAGSCWCGWDGYCMCTPSLAIDAVVEVIDPVTGEVGSDYSKHGQRCCETWQLFSSYKQANTHFFLKCISCTFAVVVSPQLASAGLPRGSVSSDEK